MNFLPNFLNAKSMIRNQLIICKVELNYHAPCYRVSCKQTVGF